MHQCYVDKSFKWVHLGVVFVYGLHSIGDRKGLLDELGQYVQGCNEELVVLWDFNTIFDLSKINWWRISIHETEDGDAWMKKYGLGFARLVGHLYSWSKMGNVEDKIYSSIGHYIANSAWLMKYEEVVIQYLNPGISDQLPLILRIGVIMIVVEGHIGSSIT